VLTRTIDEDISKGMTSSISELMAVRSQAWKAPAIQLSSLQSVNIQFKKPKSEVEEVMKSLGVSTARECGELTFDHYYSHEV
jgi:hypothetical protein